MSSSGDALGDAVARDEDAIGGVDPDLLDARIVEERLQRPEAGERRDDLPRDARLVGEQRQRTAERALAVALHLVAHVAGGERAVVSAARSNAVAAHALAHPVGDEADRAGHRGSVAGRSSDRRALSARVGDGGVYPLTSGDDARVIPSQMNLMNLTEPIPSGTLTRGQEGRVNGR